MLQRRGIVSLIFRHALVSPRFLQIKAQIMCVLCGLGKGAVGSSYGAAGSILVLLLWIYCSGLIFYFGAEFTKVYTERSGSSQVKSKIEAKQRAEAKGDSLSVAQ